MRSDKQRDASRKNGAKSRGPTTPEGKRISAMNAARRSLLTKTLLIEGESRAHFDAQLQQLTDQYHPLPGNETTLVESMATWRWRQLRLLGMETAILSHEIRNHREMSTEPLSDIAHAAFATRNLTDQSGLLRYLSVEQGRCEVQYSRALRRLTESKATRATTFHAIEPGVPEPSPCNSLENQGPPDSPDAEGAEKRT